MKIVLISLCLALNVLAEEKYDASNDNFDISEVLGNERLLKSYAKCLLNQGSCTPEVKKLKEKLPEAIATVCAKCTEKQKQTAKQVSIEVQKKHPEIWKELIEMYDPEGKYHEAWDSFLKQ